MSEINNMVVRLKNALLESYESELYHAIHLGVANGEGKWWPGGMSDAEWFCRKAGISYSPEYTKDELMVKVPDIAAQMVINVMCGEVES